jgi:hypothetical protein
LPSASRKSAFTKPRRLPGHLNVLAFTAVMGAALMFPCILIQVVCAVARPSADDSSMFPTVHQTAR